MGDIESQPFLEAIRQFRQDVGRENTLYIHLTLVPFIGTAGELKTKPTQHSVRELRPIGIQPDILLCRTDRFLPQDIKRKIALFCDVTEEAVITAQGRGVDLRGAADAWPTEGLDDDRPASTCTCRRPSARPRRPGRTWSTGITQPDRRDHDPRRRQVRRATRTPTRASTRRCTTAASPHGAQGERSSWVEAEALEQRRRRAPARRRRRHPRAGRVRRRAGTRGHDAAPRESPASAASRSSASATASSGRSVEFARNVLRPRRAPTRPSATSRRPHKVIYKLRDLLGVDDLGGTMRLGPVRLRARARVARAAACTAPTTISERHRHRYEFNRLYEQTLTAHGLRDLGHDRPTASSSRSPSCPATRGSSPCSSTPSSSRSRSARTRCSPASSARATAHKVARLGATAEAGHGDSRLTTAAAARLPV